MEQSDHEKKRFQKNKNQEKRQDNKTLYGDWSFPHAQIKKKPKPQKENAFLKFPEEKNIKLLTISE
jgi:hypothetical protein